VVDYVLSICEDLGSILRATKKLKKEILLLFFFLLLFICAYKAWVISPPCPHPLPPTPSIPSRNYFALISNFVVERV
jgi:hypothetical protein